MRDPSPQHHFWRLSTYSEKQQRQQCAGAHCSMPCSDQALPRGRPPEPRELLVTKGTVGAGGQHGKHRNWKPTEQRHHQHWAHWQEGTRQQSDLLLPKHGLGMEKSPSCHSQGFTHAHAGTQHPPPGSLPQLPPAYP